jgi:acyl-CoA thioesterase
VTGLQTTNQPTPRFPLADFLGMVTEETERGSATARVEVGDKHLNPHGAVHGAVMFAMVDTAMGAATMSVLGADQRCASIEVQLRFCRAVFDGGLAATATVVQEGKRVVQLQAEIRDSHGELVVLASGSFAVIGSAGPG